MKKIVRLGIAALAIGTLHACTTNTTKEESKVDVNYVSTYVDSVTTLTPVYTETQWAMIDDGYNSRIVEIEKRTAELDEAEKARLQASKDKYASLKAKYDAEIKVEKEGGKVKIEVRDNLLGPGKLVKDDWGFVTPANIVKVYEDFVEKVRTQGDNYSDEQWAETKALWKALNARKDMIEKEIPGKDEAKIAGLRIAYGAIKSVNRPVSNIREDIKENKENKNN